MYYYVIKRYVLIHLGVNEMTTANTAGRPKGKTGQAQVFGEKELKQVLRYVETGNHSERNKAIVIISNYLGLRAKEIASLKVKDVFDGNNIKTILELLAGYTKGNKHRDVSLENKAVVSALSEYIEYKAKNESTNPESALFRSQKGSNFSANAMTRVIKNIYVDAGYPDASSHSGRRSLITKLAYAGIDVNSIRQIAGHSSITTTQRYIDDNPHKMADILKSI